MISNGNVTKSRVPMCVKTSGNVWFHNNYVYNDTVFLHNGSVPRFFFFLFCFLLSILTVSHHLVSVMFRFFFSNLIKRCLTLFTRRHAKSLCHGITINKEHNDSHDRKEISPSRTFLRYPIKGSNFTSCNRCKKIHPYK